MAIPADSEHPRERTDDDDAVPSSSSDSSKSGQSREPVLPQRSSDELDVGWGDSSAAYDDDWYLAERPPHHG